MKLHRFLRLIAVAIILASMMPVPTRGVEAVAPQPASHQRTIQPITLQSNIDGSIEVPADEYGLPLAEGAIAAMYSKPSVLLNEGDTIAFEADIPVGGLYRVAFDMAATDAFIIPPEGQLLVDGDFPVADTRRIVFPIYFENTESAFPLDRYGNEALIRQKRLLRWSHALMRDADFSLPYPLQLELTPGLHRFEFTVTKESMVLGSIYFEPFERYPDYSEFISSVQASEPSGFSQELEAEWPAFKNDTSIRPVNNRSLGVTPYDTYRLLLNTLGGESWQRSGTEVYYEVNAPQAGLYCITLRAMQNTKNSFTVFRRITVNGEVQFEEMNAVPFPYTTEWVDYTLGGDEPMRIYLNQGVNLIGIEANNSPYNPAIEKIQKVLIDINELSLDIKKLTGNQVDQFKEWEITEYIPDIEQRLTAIADDLRADLDGLLAINQGVRSREILSYQIAIDNIEFLAANPNDIPVLMTRFSEGTGSAAQLLGTTLPLLQNQPLTIDKIFIHSADQMPEPVEVPFFTELIEGIKRFFNSFAPNPYQSIGASADELEVWVNRPRQYVDLLQTMADESFTRETGIRVKFSIMPQESKLVLAIAADIEPDVALGISTNQPYELAVRNALMDLRTFEDSGETISVFAPGSLLSYVINDSLYALPETQDFWVTFYRRDILESLGIPIPQNWDEVREILPELQRYGLNYNTVLSSGSGSKGYLLTAPYFFNHGAELYSDNGFATGLDSDEAIEALRFMAESFTIYGMPLTTSSFYESFRTGEIPIGISNLETYIKLVTAAPELVGLWGIDLYPATVLDDGRELRYATGSAQASIMFADTDKPDEAWTFLKWWVSTETQVDFQQQLVLNYGPEYLWSSANIEAFEFLSIPDEHKAVILEQWEWMQEPIKLPGSYMQEREISNAWNRIVFDGVNPRVAIDDSILIINREIARKMEEFGYMEDGVVVREFSIPSIETVEGWMVSNGE